MSQRSFPEGWNEERTREVIAHYEGQTEDEAVAEDEAGVQATQKRSMRHHESLIQRLREPRYALEYLSAVLDEDGKDGFVAALQDVNEAFAVELGKKTDPGREGN
jgi:hypothetical protein